jgi:hypothetical protein
MTLVPMGEKAMFPPFFVVPEQIDGVFRRCKRHAL